MGRHDATSKVAAATDPFAWALVLIAVAAFASGADVWFVLLLAATGLAASALLDVVGRP
jgi:hypothetical protein